MERIIFILYYQSDNDDTNAIADSDDDAPDMIHVDHSYIDNKLHGMATWMNLDWLNLRYLLRLWWEKESERGVILLRQSESLSSSLEPIDYIMQISWFELSANYYTIK